MGYNLFNKYCRKNVWYEITKNKGLTNYSFLRLTFLDTFGIAICLILGHSELFKSDEGDLICKRCSRKVARVLGN